jgi:hypothetical protein
MRLEGCQSSKARPRALTAPYSGATLSVRLHHDDDSAIISTAGPGSKLDHELARIPSILPRVLTTFWRLSRTACGLEKAPTQYEGASHPNMRLEETLQRSFEPHSTPPSFDHPLELLGGSTITTTRSARLYPAITQASCLRRRRGAKVAVVSDPLYCQSRTGRRFAHHASEIVSLTEAFVLSPLHFLFSPESTSKSHTLALVPVSTSPSLITHCT